MDKHLMASVYEILGDKQKATQIYRYILKENLADKEAESALRRVATKYPNIEGLNKDMRDFFIKARSEEELFELERWLSGN